MTDPQRTLIAVLLDRSGSMEAVKSDTEGGFNAFIDEQRGEPGEARVTLAQFDTEYEVVYANRPIADVPRAGAAAARRHGALRRVGPTDHRRGRRVGRAARGRAARARSSSSSSPTVTRTRARVDARGGQRGDQAPGERVLLGLRLPRRQHGRRRGRRRARLRRRPVDDVGRHDGGVASARWRRPQQLRVPQRRGRPPDAAGAGLLRGRSGGGTGRASGDGEDPRHGSVDRPVVDTTHGPVRGVDDGTVKAWQGIRYAAPPVGELRWRAPEPPQRWTEPADATRVGPVCPQPTDPRIPIDLGAPQGDDCLTLNVWASSDTGPGDGKPVMVWVHGGAYVLGSSAPSRSTTDGSSPRAATP